MKVLIVFLALLMINISFLSYHADMDRYVKLQTNLKAAAEEAAVGASLCQDEEQYGKGYLVIDENDAEEYISFVAEEIEGTLPDFIEADVRYEMKIFDDIKGYDGMEMYGLEDAYPSVWVKLVVDSKDLFRLPFLEKTQTNRSAIYQWDTWKDN